MPREGATEPEVTELKAQGQLTAPGLAGKVLTRTHILSRPPSFFQHRKCDTLGVILGSQLCAYPRAVSPGSPTPDPGAEMGWWE